MGADPVRQRLGPTRFRVGVVRRAERRDKNARTMLGARDGIKYRDGIAGPIDEQLLAGHMRLAHRRSDALSPVTVPLAEPTVGIALGVLASILLPEQRQRNAAPLHLRMDLRPIRIGARRRRTCIRRPKQPPLQSASSISSAIGQLRPAAAARRTYSPTAVLPIPVASPTNRRLIPIACVRRSASRIFLIDILSAGIGHSLVAREPDQLIRLSTGAPLTTPSPAVRNHRNAVRLALEPVSALHRIPVACCAFR